MGVKIKLFVNLSENLDVEKEVFCVDIRFKNLRNH